MAGNRNRTPHARGATPFQDDTRMADSSQLPLKHTLWIFMRSSMIGVVATATDLSSLKLLMHVFGLHHDVANVPSLIPGLVVMFFGNKYFAFEDHSKHVVKQGSRFLFVEAWAFLLNIMLFHILMDNLFPKLDEVLPAHDEDRAMIGRLLGTFITYFTFSFPFWTFIFHKMTPEQAEFELFLESKRKEVAAKLSGLNVPVAQTEDNGQITDLSVRGTPPANR